MWINVKSGDASIQSNSDGEYLIFSVMVPDVSFMFNLTADQARKMAAALISEANAIDPQCDAPEDGCEWDHLQELERGYAQDRM